LPRRFLATVAALLLGFGINEPTLSAAISNTTFTARFRRSKN
jgi:hypothetical protein